MCADIGYVESKQSLAISEAMYESDAAVSQYCEAHYGQGFFGINNFPEKCESICLELMAGKTKNRALDLGCSVGRAIHHPRGNQ